MGNGKENGSCHIISVLGLRRIPIILHEFKWLEPGVFGSLVY